MEATPATTVLTTAKPAARPAGGDRRDVPRQRGGRETRYRELMERYLGPRVIEAFADDDVTEVYVNPHDGWLRLDTRSQGKVRTDTRLRASRVEQFLGAVAAFHGDALGPAAPSVQAELPNGTFGGARLQGFVPPLVPRACFVVRKPARVVYDLDSYVRTGVMTARHRFALRDAIDAHENVLVCGGTGSGKTTLCNALLLEMTERFPEERIVVLEDTGELQCAADDHLQLQTSDDVSLADLVRHTLRCTPDRIVVGEVRDAAALDLLDAWATGHPGGCATLHATSARGALHRLDRLAQRANVPPQHALVAEAVGIALIVEGGNAGRKVRELVRVVGHDGADYRLEPV
jgi:type IV secretion system protein VirB11